MHALVDDKDPLRSYLVFSQVEGEENGPFLYASELYGMHLPAQLAVLSACNTGYGSMQRGEGIMSLSRAFAYAGCPSTVMSLWQAPDAETGSLMEAFYRSLQEGTAKHLALRAAKKAYIEDAYTSQQAHPFYWAGFIVSGNTAPVSGKGGSFLWPWLLGGLIAVLAGWKLGEG
ncbi:MAG: CHAT domain-containing protein [Bacteroidia bacterium]